MPRIINVLFLAAEADPFVKVGGLGDVAGSLPLALRALSNDEVQLDVRLAIPYHPVIRAEGLRPLGMFGMQRGESEMQIEAFETSRSGMPVYLINGDPIRAGGSVYSSDSKLDAEKYAFFSLAALELPRQINWHPHVIHANDWHTALSLYGALTRRWDTAAPAAAGVLTLHNLPFMGPDVQPILESYRLKLAQTDLPEWARLFPLALGLWASDSIVAVSPTYAKEILTPEYGCGLEEFLQLRSESSHGILNGLDAKSYDPLQDAALGVNYDVDSIERRAANKGLLQERLGLARAEDVPLLAMVSRMDPQKGVDLIFSALTNMRRLDYQAVILGTGDPKLERAGAELQKKYPDKIRVEARYDAGLARQIYAGADMLLMPSRYEPCGLSQMIAMRYGCVPIVRAVGGLNDTVHAGDTGFVFQDADAKSLGAAIRAALKTYIDKPAWRALQVNGMSKDFSWENSARQYLQLYQAVIKS